MSSTNPASKDKSQEVEPANITAPESRNSDASDASDEELDKEAEKYLKTKAGKRALKKAAKKLAKKDQEKQQAEIAAAAAAAAAAAEAATKDANDSNFSDSSESSNEEESEESDDESMPQARKLPSKQRDFHENLKWFQNTIDKVDKLNTKNWHTWSPRVLDTFRAWPDASQRLQGKGHFDPQLDLMLVLALQGACQTSGSNNVNFAIARPKDAPSWILHDFYVHLEKTLLKTESLNKPELLRQVSAIRMMNNDVRKLVQAIREHWSKADAMGYPLSEDLKIQTLTTQARYVQSYSYAIDSLEVNGNADDFEYIAQALILKQDRQALREAGRTAGSSNTNYTPKVMANARIAKAETNQADPEAMVSSTEITSHKYWIGKPGPNGEPSVCYHCQKPGHVAKACPDAHLPPVPRVPASTNKNQGLA